MRNDNEGLQLERMIDRGLSSPFTPNGGVSGIEIEEKDRTGLRSDECYRFTISCATTTCTESSLAVVCGIVRRFVANSVISRAKYRYCGCGNVSIRVEQILDRYKRFPFPTRVTDGICS